MKVGVFTIKLHMGGTERVIAKLSNLWNGFGCDTVFCTALPVSAGEFPHAGVAREIMPIGGWTEECVAALVRKHRFDVAVINGGWNDAFVLSIAKALRKEGVPIAVILHHSFDNWLFYQSNYRDYDKDELLTMIDCIVCVDNMQALWWSRRYDNVINIPNPVAILPINEPIDEAKRNTLIWVGRPDDKGKRIEKALGAFSALHSMLEEGESLPHLIVVGGIEDTKRQVLLGKVPPAVAECVEFAGYITDTRDVLKKARVNLVTSNWESAVPQVVLEAMSAGVPTVALDLPVLRQVSGEQGGVTIVDDERAMAKAVLGLLRDVSYWERMSRYGLSTVRTHHSDAYVSERWKELFESLQSGRVGSLASERRVEYTAEETYKAVIDEVQRSERFFVEHNLPELFFWRKWKSRFRKLLRLCTFGLV